MKKYNLERFLRAQEEFYDSYERALEEIRNGEKEGHWIWYIFPQLTELGRSDTAKKYGIQSLDEAVEYLKNETLRNRLIEISEALLAVDKNIREIMKSPDNLKVRSCMTLFREADPSIDVFQKVLDKFFSGKPDKVTLRILSANRVNDINS